MKVLVTGAKGFIGSNFIRHLKDNRFKGDLICVGREDVDLRDKKAVGVLFEEVRPQKVVHLAASMDRRNDPASRQKQWEDTFEAGKNVIEQAVKAGASHILIAGSIEELGCQGGVLDTSLPTRPMTVYGFCKSLLREVAEFVTRHESVRIDWFRPFIVYGPGQQGEMLIPYAFNCARYGKPADFTDGTQKRDFLYIEDLVFWIEKALNFDTNKSGFNIHHLGTGEEILVRDVLQAIQSEFPGCKFNIGAKPQRTYEPHVQIAPRDEGWRPEIQWREGISRTASWWRSLKV